MKATGKLVLVLVVCTLQMNWLFACSPVTNQSPVVTQAPTVLLNSERIRQQFGSYGIDVLRNGEVLRISNLYSLDDGGKITRTLAVVVFPSEIPPEVMAEHRLITDGGSIGEVFKSRQWTIVKTNIFMGEMAPSKDYESIYSLMGLRDPAPLAIHVYRLSVCKAGACHDYALIAEMHHPEYLGLDNLTRVYGTAPACEAVCTRQVQGVLADVSQAFPAGTE